MSASLRSSAAPPRAECRIDIGAYRHNVRSLAGRLVGGAQLWAVVKANAYGHDVDRVAEAAIAAGARRLCVATLSEARHLRQDLAVRVPLLVMGPLDTVNVRRAIDLDASFTVLSMDMVESLASAVADRPGRTARVHLKVDTGMGRWGVAPADVPAALERLEALPGVEVEGVMTHFATADDLDTTFFEGQLATFADVVAAVRQRHPKAIAHAANSAATVRAPESHFDAVRCGVATFGMSPTQGDPAEFGLQPVLSLRSYVADLRPRVAGESVGYCRTYVADRDATVALVPIGYADGVRRLLSNRGEALVGGRRMPLVGNVSMDHCSLLVDEGVQRGDVVTLLGADGDERITAEDHARWAETINYEITCGVAGEPRLMRSHVGR
jgi:alanine racemase